MPDIVRVSFIGAGGIARQRHIPGLKAIPGVELVGVVNRSRQSSERAAAEFGFRKVYDHWEEVMTDPEVDAVVCAAWPYLHEPVTVAALNAGKHVLCEARMARNATEARRMLEAARAHPDLVAQLVPAPFTLRVDAMVKKLLAEGAIGEVLEVDVIASNFGALDPDARQTWRQHFGYSGYNTLSLGIVYETVLRWLGPVDRVVADAAIYVPRRRAMEGDEEVNIEIPDAITVIARKGERQHQVYHLSAAHRAARGTSFELHGSAGALRIEGDRLYRASESGRWEEVEVPPELAGSWQVERQFIASIRTGAPVTLTNFEDGVRYLDFVEGAWRSWKEGRPITLPLGPM